jgi:iron complex outermembrane recepter protein
MQLWLSHTWHNFHYSQFIQGSTNFAGKQIPAVPLHSVSAGVYVKLKTNFTANISYSFIDKIPLNDANTAYADAYHLVGMKLGYEKKVGEKVSIVLSIGADNLLNENYSLGNDANGFGGRYYNASADRNYFVTIAFKSK